MSEKKVKTRTGRPCSACNHKNVKKINSLIREGRSFRSLSSQFGMADNSVSRHAENCLGLTLAALIQEKKIEQAIDVHREFEEQLVFAKKLRSAAEEYLSSEADPMRLVLIPRADEIDVVYYDFADMTPKGEPKKKTANLHALMAKVEGGLNIEADKITIKHIDIRKFALDAVNTTDTCIDKFAKMSGVYKAPEENKTSVAEIAEEVAARLIESGYTEADARTEVAKLYPEVSNAIN